VVWKCKIVNTDTRVAVKLVDLALAKKNFQIDEADIKHEIDLLQELNSPYIMKLLESQVSDGKLCLVCEFFEGMEILDLVDKFGALSEQNARKVIYDVLIGVSHMHQKKVIHRDLKLENILVKRTPDKTIDSIKIIDLGLGTKIYGEASGFFGTPN